MYEETFGDTKILYSYETPVAGWNKVIGWFKTDKHYSQTTKRHLNKYLGGLKDVTVLSYKTISEMADRIQSRV